MTYSMERSTSDRTDIDGDRDASDGVGMVEIFEFFYGVGISQRATASANNWSISPLSSILNNSSKL
jgi:hypothetical protein